MARRRVTGVEICRRDARRDRCRAVLPAAHRRRRRPPAPYASGAAVQRRSRARAACLRARGLERGAFHRLRPRRRLRAVVRPGNSILLTFNAAYVNGVARIGRWPLLKVSSIYLIGVLERGSGPPGGGWKGRGTGPPRPPIVRLRPGWARPPSRSSPPSRPSRRRGLRSGGRARGRCRRPWRAAQASSVCPRGGAR